MAEPTLERIFTEAEVAERYGRKRETVRDWRKRRRGPVFFRAGNRVLYHESALVAWEKSTEGLGKSA